MVISIGRSQRDDRAGKRYRCILNGKDVTRETFYCDSRRGIVRMYLRNDEGWFYISPDGESADSIERRGHVQLRRRKDSA